MRVYIANPGAWKLTTNNASFFMAAYAEMTVLGIGNFYIEDELKDCINKLRGRDTSLLKKWCEGRVVPNYLALPKRRWQQYSSTRISYGNMVFAGYECWTRHSWCTRMQCGVFPMWPLFHVRVGRLADLASSCHKDLSRTCNVQLIHLQAVQYFYTVCWIVHLWNLTHDSHRRGNTLNLSGVSKVIAHIHPIS